MQQFYKNAKGLMKSLQLLAHAASGTWGQCSETCLRQRLLLLPAHGWPTACCRTPVLARTRTIIPQVAWHGFNVLAPYDKASDRALLVADRLAEVLALAALSVLAAVQELASCRLRFGACRAAQVRLQTCCGLVDAQNTSAWQMPHCEHTLLVQNIQTIPGVASF